MIIFDLDGTILDSNGIWLKIDEEFLGRRGRAVTPEYNAYVTHAIFPNAAVFTKEYYHLPDSPEEIMSSWLMMAHQAYAEELPLKAGALPYLEHCLSAGEQMALFTSCEPTLCRAALAHHGLEHFFSQIIYAQQLKIEKRFPEAFRILSERLGAHPGLCTVIDDSPVVCRSAKTAGMRTIGVFDPFFAARRPEMEQICDQYVMRLDQLLFFP